MSANSQPPTPEAPMAEWFNACVVALELHAKGRVRGDPSPVERDDLLAEFWSKVLRREAAARAEAIAGLFAKCPTCDGDRFVVDADGDEDNCGECQATGFVPVAALSRPAAEQGGTHAG